MKVKMRNNREQAIISRRYSWALRLLSLWYAWFAGVRNVADSKGPDTNIDKAFIGIEEWVRINLYVRIFLATMEMKI